MSSKPSFFAVLSDASFVGWTIAKIVPPNSPLAVSSSAPLASVA